MFDLGYRAVYQKNIETAIREAENNGFKVIEIHVSSPQFLISSYSIEQLKSIKKLAEKKQIAIQIHAPLEMSLIFVNENLRKAVKKQIKELLNFCKIIGANSITLHIGKADTYHDVLGSKLKNEDIYPKLYNQLFEDSLKYIVSIANNEINVCIENTDNFNSNYQKILQKYLSAGKIFLTWDIRKNFSYETGKLIEDQWKFFQKNKDYIRNIHISGLSSSHGEIKEWNSEFSRFFDVLKNKNLSVIIEVLPFEAAIKAKEIIKKHINYGKDIFN